MLSDTIDNDADLQLLKWPFDDVGKQDHHVPNTTVAAAAVDDTDVIGGIVSQPNHRRESDGDSTSHSEDKNVPLGSLPVPVPVPVPTPHTTLTHLHVHNLHAGRHAAQMLLEAYLTEIEVRGWTVCVWFDEVLNG